MALRLSVVKSVRSRTPSGLMHTALSTVSSTGTSPHQVEYMYFGWRFQKVDPPLSRSLSVKLFLVVVCAIIVVAASNATAHSLILFMIV